MSAMIDDLTACTAHDTTKPLLEVTDLSVRFGRRGQETVDAVSEVSFSVAPGSHVGIVGESGSGKSVTSLAVMGLLPRRGVDVSGSIRFDGKELLALNRKQMNTLRGKDLAMVFQDPMTSLNPVVTVGVQVGEVFQRHQGMSRKEARYAAIETLAAVGIPDPARRAREYPFQLSGGMRQRVLIAVALACRPRLLIADEPTTALDVTVQAEMLELLKELVAGTGTALIMITHDLGVVAGLCDTVHVMYAGRIVESSPRRPLFAQPHHPYTSALLDSIPRLDAPRDEPISPIPGSPIDTIPWSTGCAFAPRCFNADERCRTETPILESHGERSFRCFHPVSAGTADDASNTGDPDGTADIGDVTSAPRPSTSEADER